MKCSICGKEVDAQDPAVLFVGEKLDDKIICDACEKKFEILYNSSDKTKKISLCKFFSERAKACADFEVREYLQDILRNGGYVEEGQEEPENHRTGTASIWVSLLRFIAWMEIIGGCIGAIVLGVGLGEALDPALGAGVTIIGIISSFIISSAIMVFLDMAADIRTIRKRVK